MESVCWFYKPQLSLSEGCFPLLKIDQMVDSASGHACMAFLNAYPGYHQIAMQDPDQEKTTFITPRAIFCYMVMPFELKKNKDGGGGGGKKNKDGGRRG